MNRKLTKKVKLTHVNRYSILVSILRGIHIETILRWHSSFIRLEKLKNINKSAGEAAERFIYC